MIECPTDETLAAHVAGGLPPGQLDGVRNHIDECDSCRELMLARGPSGPIP